MYEILYRWSQKLPRQLYFPHEDVSNSNQSRMCGKGVGLRLFPSEVEKWPFFDNFGANFGYISHIPAIRS